MSALLGAYLQLIPMLAPAIIVVAAIAWLMPNRFALAIYGGAIISLLILVGLSMPPPPRFEGDEGGDPLFGGWLMMIGLSIFLGGALGLAIRAVGLWLRSRGGSTTTILCAQAAPLVIVAALTYGIPAWQDRSPSSQCRSAVVDVTLDGVPYRLPTAPIFSATALVGSKYRTWIFHERPQLNQFCGYAMPRQPLALHNFSATFAVLRESRFETYSTKPVDAGNEARRARLCGFGALTRTACAASATEDAPRHASIEVGVDERCDCTFGHLVYALTDIIRPDLLSYPAYGEGVTRSRRETAMGAFTRFDITDTDPEWTRTNSYFRADSTAIPPDVRGNPIVFDCGPWLEEGRETVRCRTTYPIGPRTYLSYEFDVATVDVVTRAPRIDANMRAMLADLRTGN